MVDVDHLMVLHALKAIALQEAEVEHLHVVSQHHLLDEMGGQQLQLRCLLPSTLNGAVASLGGFQAIW